MRKEIPILFSTPMVQATFNGLKTMTRRTSGLKKINQCPDEWFPYVGDFYVDFNARLNQKFYKPGKHSTHAECPYGQPGDILWVRESFMPYQPGRPFIYKAELNQQQLESGTFKFKPSIHMPKDACRIWLEVTDIKVERAQSISQEDILAEGVRFSVNGIGTNRVLLELGTKNKAIDFLPEGCLAKDAPKLTQQQLLFAHWAELWCDVNGRESWDLNPWVWVVSFKVLSTTGRPENLSSLQKQSV